MKTYYDIMVKTTNGDTFQLKGVSFSMMMQLANQSNSIQIIEIKKEYSKKLKSY